MRNGISAALAIIVIYGHLRAQGGPMWTEASSSQTAVVQPQVMGCGKTTERKHNCWQSSTRARASKYEPLIAQVALKYHVDPRVLWTIAFLESRFQPQSISRTGARGLMQFMPGTAARYGLLTLEKMHDPNASIDAAARHLRDLMSRFGNRLELILAAYNAGETAVMAYRSGQKLMLRDGHIINPRGIRTNGVPPYPQTLAYVANGQIVLKAITGSGIFSATLISRCGPVSNSNETSQQTGEVNATISTHSFYVTGSTNEELPTTKSLPPSAENLTGPLPK